MKLLILLLLTVCVGCNEIASAPAEIKSAGHAVASVGCGDAAERLALDRLFPELNGYISNYLDVWMSHDYSASDWEPKFSEQQAKLDKLRKWASSLPDRCAQQSYLGWIEYYQGELNSARSELRNHATKNEMDDYDKELEKERRDVHKFAEEVDGKFPEPPRNLR